jgi:hypothetical protein
MSEAVQEPVQGRDGAVRREEPVVTVPWQARTDDKSALLVSERATVFDRKAKALQPVDPMDAISDPIWNDKGGTAWTPDLVHCRLLVAGEVVKRLPPVLRSGYVSQLGSLAISEMTVERRIAPTPMEISLADWTLTEIMARRHRQQMLLAALFGLSFDKIAEALRARKQDGSKTSVQRWYLEERRILAGQWQGRRNDPLAKIDELTADRWQTTFSRRRK